MIYLESRDSVIWNIDKKIIEIIKECLSSNETVVISTTNEGVCLRTSYFYDLLDNLCNEFNISKSRFEIQTPNIEEFHDEYKIVITPNLWVDVCKNEPIVPQPKNSDLYAIGCFIGKINWARLSMLAWLDQYPNKALTTCHYAYTNDDSDLTRQASLQLNESFLKLPNEIELATKFLKSCPRLMPSKFMMPFPQNFTIQDVVNIAVNFSEGYSSIFAELICETYFSGLTFFPTEKTFRPMQQLTPFIVQGPQGFLTNLHRSGFKTFSKYWDESYDELTGVARILKIREIATQLFDLSQLELQKMYNDMKPILEHNKKRLSTLQPEDLLLDE